MQASRFSPGAQQANVGLLDSGEAMSFAGADADADAYRFEMHACLLDVDTCAKVCCHLSAVLICLNCRYCSLQVCCLFNSPYTIAPVISLTAWQASAGRLRLMQRSCNLLTDSARLYP